MAGTDANVIIENIQGIYYDAVGTAPPTIAGTLAGTIDASAWSDVGFIDPEAKIKVGFGGNLRKVRPMSMEGNLKGIVTQKFATLEFSGLEDTIVCLGLALNGASGAGGMTDGGDGELGYIALLIVTTNIVYHFKKVAPNHELAKEISDSEESRIPFVLETYIEEAATAGERQWKITPRA